MRKRKTHQKRTLGGFTLAELVVVVTVLAILAAIGFLALSGYTQDAKDSAVKTNVRSVYSAIMAESTSAGYSPRYYIVHDPAYAITGGIVAFDGNPEALTGGDWNVPGTNYSAGNPDYAKLKLNKEKFKTASARDGFRRGFADAFAAPADPTYLLVGAMDATETPSG
ncbi:MAG: prepilin-type N-terminal cleavage/methylation domain-containing protein [Patescibacteria group bacterium]